MWPRAAIRLMILRRLSSLTFLPPIISRTSKLSTFIMPKIVIVSTSASQWKGGPSGVWLEEVACPYYVFTAAGHEVSKSAG